jgi:hypothetical protein
MLLLEFADPGLFLVGYADIPELALHELKAAAFPRMSLLSFFVFIRNPVFLHRPDAVGLPLHLVGAPAWERAGNKITSTAVNIFIR